MINVRVKNNEEFLYFTYYTNFIYIIIWLYTGWFDDVLQELEEEEDTLNREFGAVCADISCLQESADNISHEIISLTALLETASGIS